MAQTHSSPPTHLKTATASHQWFATLFQTFSRAAQLRATLALHQPPPRLSPPPPPRQLPPPQLDCATEQATQKNVGTMHLTRLIRAVSVTMWGHMSRAIVLCCAARAFGQPQQPLLRPPRPQAPPSRLVPQPLLSVQMEVMGLHRRCTLRAILQSMQT